MSFSLTPRGAAVEMVFLPVKVNVIVTPKKNVLDPQGAAVHHALESQGFAGLGKVRVGKLIELEMEGPIDADRQGQIDRICQDLLSNPVIEDYRWEVES